MSEPTRDRVHRFTHINLENWRNFSHVDVDLQRRMFLIGPNASGKSNLLDVFRFLYDIVSVGGGFQQAVLKRGGVSRLRSLAARRYPEIAIRVSLGDEGIGLNEVLLLEPSGEGTTVRTANEFTEVPPLLEAGMTLSEAIMPRTRPERVEQLTLFGT